MRIIRLIRILSVLVISVIVVSMVSCSCGDLFKEADQQTKPTQSDTQKKSTNEKGGKYSEYQGKFPSQPLPDNATVGITKYGECYHRLDCPFVTNSEYPIKKMPKSEAKKKHYKRCDICTP